MLKVKKITLSGFRGILNPQPLDLIVKGNKEPHSLVLFGLNSSGKTSFVDGLEWFLSEENKIAIKQKNRSPKLKTETPVEKAQSENTEVAQ